MTRDLIGQRAKPELALLTGAIVLALSGPWAWADVGGRDFVLAVSARDMGSLETTITEAANGGATGVLLVVEDVSGETAELVRRASAPAAARDLELWIGIARLWEVDITLVKNLAAERITGIALLFHTPQGEPPKAGDLTATLEVKKRGEQLGQLIRQIKAGLREGRKLVVCVAATEIDPETARDRFVPVKDLIRDGTLDHVCLAGAERMNLHRLRLLRDAPLRTGVFLDPGSSEERHWAGLLERAVLAAVDNPTSDCLWLSGFPTELTAHVVPQSVKRREQAKARQKALEEAIVQETLTVDQEVSEKGCNDQATVHGVAQSFVPSRDGACPLVQIYAAIRGCPGPLPPPLNVEICEDDGGKPGQTVVANTEIPAAEFGHEPTYRWGSVYFDPPVKLRQGRTYWIHLPAARHLEGSFVWRIVKDAATARGRAWSRSYAYANHTWVFRAFMTKENPNGR